VAVHHAELAVLVVPGQIARPDQPDRVLRLVVVQLDGLGAHHHLAAPRRVDERHGDRQQRLDGGDGARHPFVVEAHGGKAAVPLQARRGRPDPEAVPRPLEPPVVGSAHRFSCLVLDVVATTRWRTSYTDTPYARTWGAHSSQATAPARRRASRASAKSSGPAVS